MDQVNIVQAVIIVLEPNAGDILESLSAIAPLWVVATDANKTTYTRLWTRCKDTDHRKVGSITDFKVKNVEQRLKNLLDVIPNVELHHALQEGDVIEVVGINWSEDVITELQTNNFAPAGETNTGILARKVQATAST